MKRVLLNKLIAWKNSPLRKPLILRGARQVGKTFLLKELGKAEYRQMVYCNFESDPKLSSLFSETLKPKEIISALSSLFSLKITPNDTLIIFDEVQQCPSALTALKYFNEQANEFHIACAGSLLGIVLSQPQSFPVGKVDLFTLYPLSFFEFCQALGKESLLLSVKPNLKTPQVIHDELVKLLKLYLFVGGMPEAVQGYLETEDLLEIKTIHENINTLYMLDIAKHAQRSEVLKIRLVWERLPSQLAKENKKVLISSIYERGRLNEVESSLRWLIDAGIVLPALKVSSPQLPLRAFSDERSFKMYILDVGLLASFLGVEAKTITQGNELFQNLKGAFTENFVAQELTASGFKELFYWTSQGEAEIDFILSQGDKIVPLEVKSGINLKSRSLTEFGKRHPKLPLIRTSLLNFQQDGKIINVPLYSIGNIGEYFNSLPPA